MSSRDFYASLPVFTDFDEVTQPANFRAVPDDWHVLMSDVRDSTAAVRAGDYRHVNFLGAATITAILNLAGDTEVPFVFEGDGSMLCVPRPWVSERSAVAYPNISESGARAEITFSSPRSSTLSMVARRPLRSPIVSPMYASGAETVTSRIGSRIIGPALGHTVLNASEAATLNAISEESTL